MIGAAATRLTFCLLPVVVGEWSSNNLGMDWHADGLVLQSCWGRFWDDFVDGLAQPGESWGRAQGCFEHVPVSCSNYCVANDSIVSRVYFSRAKTMLAKGAHLYVFYVCTGAYTCIHTYMLIYNI